MWPSRAHILKPLTDKSGLKNKYRLKFMDEMKKSYNKMRLLMAADALATYPNHNNSFDIYTEASYFQLGACIMQDGQPVTYFSRNLNKA